MLIDTDTIVNIYLTNKKITVKQLAIKFNLHPRNIRSILMERNIPIRNNRYKLPELHDPEYLALLTAKKLTTTQIAKMLGCHIETVQKAYRDSTKMARSPLPLGGGGIASDTFMNSHNKYIICNR
ncbi:hypothetical protein [Bacteroides sp.]|uniref:hypothetical protein n=1 Tax=Bacteroides sp. TaxID=29523 RepID=UPI00261D2592|nr:hypothetical protein [Bacteroides sp.]MDD3040702.1 hypothetical protein [Bacteroides sp.]